jgi:hypothetical protein
MFLHKKAVLFTLQLPHNQRIASPAIAVISSVFQRQRFAAPLTHQDQGLLLPPLLGTAKTASN